LKKLKTDFQHLKIRKESINVFVNSSKNKREGEIYQNEASNNKYLIRSKDSR
jgi:hypothetical protein